jgi:hypothetical protein
MGATGSSAQSRQVTQVAHPSFETPRAGSLARPQRSSTNTRDARGKLVSTNTPDAGLLFGDDDE